MPKKNSGFIMDRDGNSVVKNTEVTVQDVLRERTREMVKQGAEELAEKEFRKDPLVVVDKDGNVKSNPVHGQLNDDFTSVVRQGLTTNVFMGVEKDNFMTMNTSRNKEVDSNDPRSVVLTDASLIQLFVLSTEEHHLGDGTFKGQPLIIPLLGESYGDSADVIGQRVATVEGWNGEVVRGKWSLDIEEIEHPTLHLYNHITKIDFSSMGSGSEMYMLNVTDVSSSLPIPAIFTPDDTDKYDPKRVILNTVIIDDRKPLKHMVVKNELLAEDVADEKSLEKVWVTLINDVSADNCSGIKGGSGNLEATTETVDGDDILNETVLARTVGGKTSLVIKDSETGEEVHMPAIHIVNVVKKNAASEKAKAVFWDGVLPESEGSKPDELLSNALVVLRIACPGYEDLIIECPMSTNKLKANDTRPTEITVKENTLVLTVQNLKDDPNVDPSLTKYGLHHALGEEERVEKCDPSAAVLTGSLKMIVGSEEKTFEAYNTTSWPVVEIKNSPDGLVASIPVHPSDGIGDANVIIIQVSKLVDNRQPKGQLVFSLEDLTIDPISISNSPSTSALLTKTKKGEATVITDCLSSMVDNDISSGSQLLVKKITFEKATLCDQYKVMYPLTSINGSALVVGRVSKLSDLDVTVTSDLVVEAKEDGSDKGLMTVTAVSADGSTLKTMQIQVTITDSRT